MNSDIVKEPEILKDTVNKFAHNDIAPLEKND